MNYTDRDRTLALAGIFQAAYLTQELARRGVADDAAFAASIGSIFVLDADATEGIYGDVSGVLQGLRFIRDKVSDRSGTGGMELARYVLALVQLENRLHGDPDVLEQVSKEIERVKARAEEAGTFSSDAQPHPDVVTDLADLYEKTLSNLPPRVMVNGEPENLRNTMIVNKIRAVLLAGVRAAVLWRQVGGRRWHLLFKRRRYVAQAAHIISVFEAERTVH